MSNRWGSELKKINGTRMKPRRPPHLLWQQVLRYRQPGQVPVRRLHLLRYPLQQALRLPRRL